MITSVMGTICSHGVVTLNDTSSSSPSSNGSSITHTTSTKTIQSPGIWNPFQITKNEAEDLLKSSGPGAFVFSHDLTSEIYLSLCVGKYVCHHAVLTRDNAFYVGARKFDTIGEVIDYFTDHPLGEMTLREEYKSHSQAAPVIQVRQHPDFSIQTANTPSTSETSESDLIKNSLTIQNHAFKDKSPVLRRPPTNRKTPVDRIEEENCDENNEDIEIKNNVKNKKHFSLQLPNNKVSPLPKKPLVRSTAVDTEGSSTSEDEREMPSSISLMPVIPQDYTTTTTQVYTS